MRNSFNSAAKMIAILAVFSLLIVSSAAVMAQSPSASTPTWTECQTWAISGKSNLSSVMEDNLCTLKNELADLGHNTSIDYLDVKGQASSCIVFKVNDVTEKSYILEYSAAINVQANVNVKISGEFPVSGIYSLNSMKYVSASVCGTASLCLSVTSCGTVTIDRSTMAIERIVSNTAVDQSLSLKVDSTPSMGALLDGLNVKVSYNVLDIDESLHLKLNTVVDFSPALPLLKFPLSVGNNWTVDSTMTVTGKVTGIFKATGLPSSLLSKIDENAAAFNGTLYLQDLPSLGSIPLNKGAFGPIPIMLNTSMTCVGVSVADQSCYNKGSTVFDVVESRTGTHVYYSPDTEFITGIMLKPQLDLNGLMSLPTGSILSPSVLTDASTGPPSDAAVTSSTSVTTVTQPSGEIVDVAQLIADITMVPTDPAVATHAIENITTAQGLDESTTPAATANTVSGATPQDSSGLLGTLAAIAIVGAAMGGVVVFRMKKNEP